MKNIVSVKGEEILKAAIAGRKACLRRKEDINVEQLAEGIKECYDYFMLDLTQEEYDAVRANTKGKWQNALLPVCFIKAHKHVVNGKNMPTVRVHMGHKPGAVFDIKVQDWNKLIALDGVQ